MPWENNGGGGPWGSSGGSGGNRGGGRGNGGGGNGGGPRSPWGGGPGGGGGRGPGGQQPDVEEIVRKGQERIKKMMPGGGIGAMGVAAILIIVVVGWLATGFYRVEPDQQGVELVFGELSQTTGPGLNYNLPAPIGEVMTPRVTTINQVSVGYISLAAGGTREVPEESLMLTGDENIVSVRTAVFWKIRDAGDYLFNVRNPEESVKNASEAALREIVGKSDFEFIRTRGRAAVEADAKERIQEILDSYGAGIEVTEIQSQAIEPPPQVIDAFRDVQAASADRVRAVNEATAYFNQVTQRAEGEAQRILRAAEAYKEERIARADGDAQRFLSILGEYENAPEITQRRIYLQTMEEILEQMDKVLIENGGDGGGSGVLPYLPLDRLTPRTGGATQ